MCLLKRWWTPLARQTWMVSALLINKFGQGMTMGMMSALITALQAPDSDIKIDLEVLSWLASSLPIATLFGLPIVSLLMNKFGRKAAYSIKNVPAIIGQILAGYCTNITGLMISRILCGVSIGSTAILGAMVIGECTSPRYRGMFLTMKTAFFNMGCLSIHVLTNYIDWRTASIVSTIPFVISSLIALTWPESPSWLAEQKQFQKSIDTFYWLRGESEESTREIEEIIQMYEFKSPPKTFYKTVMEFLKKFKKKNFLKPFLITIFTSVILECSGRHVFPSYAAVLIKSMISKNLNTFYVNIFIDVLITVSAFSSSYLIKTFELRKLLFSTGFASVVILNLSCLNLYFVTVGILSSTYAWVPISLLCVYFIVVNLCCSPIPLTIIGEIFPLEHRAVGTLVSGYIMGVVFSMALKITPYLLATFNTYGAFAMFAAGLAGALLVLYFILPETKHRTLQDIEYFFVYGKYRGKEKLNDDDEVMKRMMSDNKV